MADDINVFADDAQGTRERISATIDELQERLNPRRIVGDAVGSVQSSGQDLINHGLQLLRAHPAAFAAGGLVLGLVALGTNKLGKAKVNYGDDVESYSDFEDDYSAQAAPSGERFSVMRGSTGARIESNPIIAVLIGVAAGALLGALFPETERERELFGERSARLGAAAKAAARTARDEFATARGNVAEVTGHAKSAVQSVVGAAKAELNG